MPISSACKKVAHEKKSFVFFINALPICANCAAAMLQTIKISE